MKNGKIILGIILVFVLGVLCGLLSSHIMNRYRIESILSGKGQSREEFIFRKLDHKLGLDAGQKDQIRAIIHETHEEIRTLRNRFKPQTEAIIANSQARISLLLNPEQRKKYEQMIAERRERNREKGF
jgi:hypothetical protein